MFALRTIEYDSQEDSEKIFYRLKWRVKKVNSLIWQLVNSTTKSTNKPWIGILNDNELSFKLIEPRGIFSFIFLQIVISGKITKRSNDQTAVVIKIKPGWYTLLFFTFLYLASTLVMGTLIADWNKNDLFSGLLWILTFPGLGTYLLYRKLNIIETKFEETIGLKTL